MHWDTCLEVEPNILTLTFYIMTLILDTMAFFEINLYGSCEFEIVADQALFRSNVSDCLCTQPDIHVFQVSLLPTKSF